MTEREKLIKLLKEKQDYGIVLKENQMDDRYNYTKEISNISVADYLLENGIIALPVRVGDIVYTNRSMQGWYMKLKDRPYEARVVYIGVNGKDNFMNVAFLKNDNMLSFRFSEIGKTVFLTREEAENALKGKKK